MKETGWEKAEDLIRDLHAAGPGVPAAREAVAQAETEGERLINLIHGAGPNKPAPKCATCAGRTTACGAVRDADPGCRYSLANTAGTLQQILDNAWSETHAGKKPGENRLI